METAGRARRKRSTEAPGPVLTASGPEAIAGAPDAPAAPDPETTFGALPAFGRQETFGRPTDDSATPPGAPGFGNPAHDV